MATALDMINNLNRFDVKTQTTKVFTNNAVHVIELNQAQMLKGVKSSGAGIGTYSKSPLGRQYAEFKAQLNPEAGAGNVDLKLTGSFYRGMKMEIRGENINIESSDRKAAQLETKYDKDKKLYGLTKENWQIWLDEIFMPDYMIEFTKATGLKI